MEISAFPLVTVIIPVYNVELWLSRCLDSVINQTFRNLEIILVDDGSNDCSGQICEDYKNKDSRITVIHQSNGGLSSARNTGIAAAHGDYLSFIDSDDYISNCFIETLVSVAVKEKSEIVICSYIQGSAKQFYFRRNPKYKRVKTYSSEDALENWHKNNKHLETVAWNKLYKKDLFDNGIRYPVGMYFEDVPTTHRLIASCHRVTFCYCKLYYYYQRSTSIQSSSSDKKILHRIIVQKTRLEWFLNHRYLKAYKRLFNKYLLYLAICYCQADKKSINELVYSEIKKALKNKKYIYLHNVIFFLVFLTIPNVFKSIYSTCKR